MKCPKCASDLKQHKVGKNPSGSQQRYQCYLCKCKYTPEKKPHSHSAEIRQKAVQMYIDGITLRQIARTGTCLGVTTDAREALKKGLRSKNI